MDNQTIDLRPNRTDWDLAREVHDEFAQKPGATHIATEFALAHLSALVRAVRPTKVLEFGAGIGTISQLLLSHPPQHFELITDPELLDLERQYFDLVVIDGLLEPGQFNALQRDSFCFVEGSRKSTRKTITKELQRRNLTITFENYNRGVRYFDWSMQFPDGRARKPAKFKFRKILKGC